MFMSPQCLKHLNSFESLRTLKLCTEDQEDKKGLAKEGMKRGVRGGRGEGWLLSRVSLVVFLMFRSVQPRAGVIRRGTRTG